MTQIPRIIFSNSNFQSLFRFFVILTILLSSVFFGLLASISLLKLIGIIISSCLLLVLLLRKPELGVVAIFPISFFIKTVIGTGTNVPLNITFLWVAFLIGLWFLRMFVIQRNIPIKSSRVTLPAFLFCLAILISFIAGNINPIPFASDKASLPAQIGGGLLYVLSITTFLYVGSQIHKLSWLKAITWLFLILSGFYLVGFEIPKFWNISSKFYNTSSTGSMFWIWIVALSAGQLLFNNKIRLVGKLFMGGLILLTLYIGWFYNKEWVSGWLPPLLALWVIVFFRNLRYGLILTLIGATFLILNFTTFNAEVMTTTQQYSIESRAWTLPILFQLLKYSPILGLGPANYYHYTTLYPINGFYVEFNSHNNYVDIVSQTGLVGFALFGWLAFEIGYLAWQLRKSVKDGFCQGYIYACLGGLVGMLVSGFLADWFLPFLYNIGIPGFRASVFAWVFMGGLISIETMNKSSA
jgi:hypothetical protein